MTRSILAVAALIACLALGGCAARDDGVTVVRFWAMGREGEYVAKLLPDFEKTHPDIRIDLQQLPWTAAHEKLLTAFAGDALPDIFQLGNTWLPELVTLGAIDPLDEEIAASPAIDPADYFGGIWDTNVIAGKVYGVPWYVDTRLLFYRKDILARAGFDAPPRDWDEWSRQLAAVKRVVGPDRYSIMLPLDEFEPLLQLAVEQPDPLLKDHGTRGNFESAGFRHAFTYYVDMFRNGWAPPMSETQISNVWDEFGRGFFSFYITGPWNIGEFRRRLPKDLADAWGTAPLPGPDGKGAGVAGGTSLVINRRSTHAKEAWQLIEFLSAPAQELRFYELTGDLPPRRSTWNDPALAADVHAKAFRDQLERVKPTPKVPEWERIAQEMRIVAERAVRGGEPIDRALADLDQRADAILEKRRWMVEHGTLP